MKKVGTLKKGPGNFGALKINRSWPVLIGGVSKDGKNEAFKTLPTVESALELPVGDGWWTTSLLFPLISPSPLPFLTLWYFLSPDDFDFP